MIFDIIGKIEMGLYLVLSPFFPFLKQGVTFAIFKVSVKFFVLVLKFKIWAKGAAMS